MAIIISMYRNGDQNEETFDPDGSSSLQALLAGFTNGTASTEI